MTNARIAFVFPGQGTQRVGMGVLVCSLSEAARAVFDRASEVLGRDVKELCTRADPETLQRTENAQVAVFTTNAASLAMLEEMGLRPGLVAGHSVGEFSAYYAASALTFEDALVTVARRAELMAGVAEAGSMVSVIGLDEPTLRALCERSSSSADSVVVAVDNAPGNFVCSGGIGAVERLRHHASAAGALRVVPVRTSHAFHSSIFDGVIPEWSRYVADLRMAPPEIPVALNTTGTLSTDVEEIRIAAIEQVNRPVRWTDCVRSLVADGVATIIESGDSKVLTSFARTISPGIEAVSMGTPQGLRRLGKPAGAQP